MPSPFPGMDPYLEEKNIWSNFHYGLAYEIQSQLNHKIQPGYFARAEYRVTYDVIEITTSYPVGTHTIYPDVAVWQMAGAGAAIAPSPLITPAPSESVILEDIPIRLYSVEIRQTETKFLVCAIEILSPVNKRPNHEAYHEYLRKRRDILRSSTHLIEIDLLRKGTRPPLNASVPDAPYYVTLSRANRRPRVEVWPIQLWEALPVLPVPLLEPDPDVPLELGTAVSSVYERGAYHLDINYQEPLPPPLTETEQERVSQLLKWNK